MIHSNHSYCHRTHSKFIVKNLIGLGIGLLISVSGFSGINAKKDKPYRLETINDSDFKKIILTSQAVQRLGITTELSGAFEIPYAALVYGTHGEEWVYTNPEPDVYLRTTVTVDRIQGNETGGIAYISSGLKKGTRVVTYGAAELWGVEFGVGK